MADREKVLEAAEKFARITRESREKVIDHALAAQERNGHFARGVVEGYAEELRRQAEANRAMAWKLVERAGEQSDALRTVVEGSFQASVDAYRDLASAPLSYYRRGFETAGGAAR